MRTSTLIATVIVAFLATDSVEAQRRGGGRGGNRNQWRRPAEISNRTAVYFSEVEAPATNADKVADLNTIDMVRAAAATGQPTLLYLHDSEADKRVVQQFESQLFRSEPSGDKLGLKLRMFHCGQIDISQDQALKNRYGKKIPLFVAFDKAGKELKQVSMAGYKAKVSALEAQIDQASTGAYKPSVKSIVSKYVKIIADLEAALKAKASAEQDKTKANGDRSKIKKAERAIEAATKLEEKQLKLEEKLLEGLRLPALGDKKVGGRNPRRGNQAGNTGRGNTGAGNTGRGNTGAGNTGRGNKGK